MAKKQISKNQIVVYQAKSGALELKRDANADTIWASLDQIASVFGRDKSVISRHIKNIFSEGELMRNSVVAIFATTAADGKTYKVEYFNLDLILSVGYRVNSKQATLFRQWATKTLRQYIVEGYAINRARIEKNYEQFLEAVQRVKRLLPTGAAIDTQSVLELVNAFADTWLSLDAYDKGKLSTRGTTKKRVALTAEKLKKNLATFKTTLAEKGEASEHFGVERNTEAVEGIVGNVMQSFAGKELYETAEEKAAHLLYFMVKNHPFVDGNKRSGAYAFVWFLNQASILHTNKLTPPALTALTLLVAESDPKDKERMVGLITSLLTPRDGHKFSSGKGVVVGKGKIFGKGVFAARDFKEGEVVIKYNLKALSNGEYKNLPKDEKCFVHTHVDTKYLYAEPERYVNHSSHPNTFQNFEIGADIAIKDIKKDEQITTNATKDDI